MTLTDTLWSPHDYCIDAAKKTDGPRIGSLAHDVYRLVCRTDFDVPGFCLIDVGPASTSQSLRRLMVGLKREMQAIHQSQADRNLMFLSMGRFDQQITTKPHRDGGPDEGFLMLGYEPSELTSEVFLSDYSKCAFEMGLTPSEFLDRHNPMFITDGMVSGLRRGRPR